jgi:phosphatidylglycerol lysyltransferase
MGEHMFKIKKDQLFKVIKVMFPLLLLILAIYEIQQTARGVDVVTLRSEVSQLQPWELALILLVSFCAVTPMFFYDIILVKLLGIKMKTRELIQHSFIVNTYSNLIGFGGLVGLMLRSYFYSKQKEEKEGGVKKYRFRHTLLSNGNLTVSMDFTYLILGFPVTERNTMVIYRNIHC